jgi:hypothetical protein
MAWDTFLNVKKVEQSAKGGQRMGDLMFNSVEIPENRYRITPTVE